MDENFEGKIHVEHDEVNTKLNTDVILESTFNVNACDKQILDEEHDRDILDSWKDEYKKINNVKDLATFVDHLMNDYTHDYGTIIHAMYAAMMATFYCLEHSPQGGITGFQASCLGHMFIKEFFMLREAYRIIDYGEMLYPQCEDRYTTIPVSIFNWLRDKAKEELLSRDMHPKVREHMEKIVAGEVPFGFKVKDDD